jgi:oxygen-independent coproporphyrinogen-3 oxidase
MAPETVDRVLSAIRAAWPLANDVEITLEANPTSVEADRFRAYRDAGVSRVSLGVQALNDADLKRLGRLHSADEAIRAMDLARETFDRVSFDLIYARQDQDLQSWEAELRAALTLGPDHLSLYQLTIEPGTAFGARFAAGGLRGLPDEDLAADLYELTQDICGAAGLPAYEVSNHAVPGQESRHNLIYWWSGDWLGIGPGAHGRLSVDGRRLATDTPLGPTDWLRQVEVSGVGETERTELSAAEHAEELVMMGLRLNEGVSLSRYAGIRGQALNVDRIDPLIEQGLLALTGDRLRTTPRGRPLLNAILSELLV